MRALLLTTATLVLSGCVNNSAPESTATAGTQCAEPRPQVCTMEYNPVCATLVAGGSRQYASGCNACADDAVASHLLGPCPVAE